MPQVSRDLNDDFYFPSVALLAPKNVGSIPEKAVTSARLVRQNVDG
jgi:hypothetical protein